MSRRAPGSNTLLRDGAIVIAEVADALALLGVTARAAPARESSDVSTPADLTQRAVWHALESPAPDLDALAARASLPARRASPRYPRSS